MPSFMGWSVALFVGAAGFNVLIGVLTPVVAPRTDGTALLFTERADGEALGADTDAVLTQFPGLEAIRQAWFGVLAGLLLMGGVLEGAVAWFGLRTGQRWALPTLTAAAIVAALLWVYVLSQYWRAGARPTLGDTPPFMWVTMALHVPAIVLGWVGWRA